MLRFLLILLVFTSHNWSTSNFSEVFARYWYATVDGKIGDPGSEARVDDSGSAFSLGTRMDFGHSISELIYTRFSIDSPLLDTGNFLGAAFPRANTTYEFDGHEISFRFKRFLHDTKDLSVKWIYGLNYLKLKNKLVNSTAGIYGTVEPEGYIPIVGLEGEWYITNKFSFRSQFLYSNFNISSDEIRSKDMEFGLVYSPIQDVDVELGYRNYSLDIFTEGNIEIQHDIKGPYAQANWFF
jgi:hypothetical protein